MSDLQHERIVELEDERAELRAEIERLRADREQYNSWAEQFKSCIETLRTEIAQLRADFLEYGNHKPECRGGDGDTQCTCGYLNALFVSQAP